MSQEYPIKQVRPGQEGVPDDEKIVEVIGPINEYTGKWYQSRDASLKAQRDTINAQIAANQAEWDAHNALINS